MRVASVFVCALLLLLLAANAQAQSTDLDQPTPVTSSQIAGQITARDIGDSRLTRHFYILTGTPGDLVLTVESQNLNGDVDLFQAGTLRPLAKVSMYAGELSTSTSKSIYLRQRETIILRVEARTPNDDKGSYRVSFSGGFEAMAAPAVQPETDAAEQTPATARRDKNTRRVSSVGARIDEPEPIETAKTTQPETSTDRAADSADASNKSAATDNAGTTTSPASVTTARPQRPPSSRNNRRRRGRNVPAKPPETTAQNNPTTDVTEEPPAVVTKPSGIEAGAKLIIETRDGMRVERFMSTVRRVTVENGQIVVFMRDGKITRHPMASVVRMAIEP
jgi:hypothetical protein